MNKGFFTKKRQPATKKDYDEIIEAIKRNDVGKIRDIMGRGLDINTFSDTHPMTMAGRYGHVEIIKTLLSAGAEINKIYSGEPPLFTAARSGRVDLVEFLLAAGADINGVALDEKNTALMKAAEEGREKVVEILLSAGALPNVKNDKGFTALMFAAKSGYYNVAQLLIDKKAQLEAKNREGLTAFDLAVKYKNVPVAELLNPAAKELMLGCPGKKYRIASTTGKWLGFKEAIAADISSLPGFFTFSKFHYELWLDRHGIMPHMIITVFDNSIGICDIGAPEEIWTRLRTLTKAWLKNYDSGLTLTGFN